MPDSPEPKFRRRSDARPDEILDAALSEFLKNGYARTTMDKVARAANLSKGAVYLYFPSKEALLESLVRRAVSPMTARAVEALQTGADHPRETLEQILRNIVGILGDEKTLAVPMLVIREAPSVPQIAQIYRDEVLSQMIPALSGMLDRARRAGHIRDVDPEMAVRSIVGPILTHVLLAKVFGIVPDGGLQIDRLVETHFTILFDGLAPREPLT